MKEYARGALEALSWAMLLLIDVKELPDLQKAMTQIDQAINKLRSHVAKDFPENLTKDP